MVKQRGDAHLLLCDIDGGRKKRVKLAHALRNLAAVARTLGEKVEYIALERSSSKRGWHLTIRTQLAHTKIEQIAMQLLIGSDPARERLNLMRAMSQVEYAGWQLLFSRKLI